MIVALNLASVSPAFAGGGGLLEYYCNSATKHVSVTLVSQLGSDLYKPGLQLLVSNGNDESIYSIVNYSDDGNLIQFSLNPIAGQPDLGDFVFSDWEKPSPRTIIQVTQDGKTIKATDIHCDLVN